MTLRLPTPTDDGFPCDKVGDWARQKHHFLQRYMDAFVTAMRPKQWAALHYVDLFAGSGLSRVKSTGELIWGSPLIAAHTRFDRLHLCEKKTARFDALVRRVQRVRSAGLDQVLHGDANEKVTDIVKEIQTAALSLAFLDPYGLHLDFDSVKILNRKRVDLIIFFPDHLDALRNWELYESQPGSNLDRFLGNGVNWTASFGQCPRDRRAEELRKAYEGQLRALGYNYFEYERIHDHNRPLYRLVFASKHPAGAKIWRGIAGVEPDGQRRLFQ